MWTLALIRAATSTSGRSQPVNRGSRGSDDWALGRSWAISSRSLPRRRPQDKRLRADTLGAIRERDMVPATSLQAGPAGSIMRPGDTVRRMTAAVPPISELTRIEPVYLDRLDKQGIFTTGILLEVSETPTRRQYLADHVGATINEVVDLARRGH